MRHLTLGEVLSLHALVLERWGGRPGIRDLGGLVSAIAQPRITVGGEDAYPSLESKAAALCYSLVSTHPFIDGNKRVAHASMEIFLILNGLEIDAPIDEQERVMLSVAAGSMSREELASWLSVVIRPTTASS
jgi:death-on-curing protein